MQKKSKSVLALSAMLVATLALSSCTSMFTKVNGSRSNAPSAQAEGGKLNPAVDPKYAKYYTQSANWGSCNPGKSGFECATVKAPLSWNKDSGDISLALIRKTTTGKKLGSLFVNPGGPGQSGVNLIADNIDFAVGKPLQANFDVIGFDPRGVGASTAVKCYDAKQMDTFVFDINPNPRGSDAWVSQVEKKGSDFAAACAKNTGELLGEVDTVSAARDLDILRAVVGDNKLNYLGYSYGTFLGATYAGLFPKQVGRLALDGALDPSVSDFEVVKAQAVGFESALKAYLANCLTQKSCPFAGLSVEASMSQVQSLLDKLDSKPVQGGDGRKVGADTMLTAIVTPLYSKSNWQYRDRLFADAKAGKVDTALILADSYYSRTESGTYSDNSAEAFYGVNCLDYSQQSDRNLLKSQAAEIRAAAPTFGKYIASDAISCAGWPYKAKSERKPITAAGSDPIMVVGTMGDPAVMATLR